MHPGSWVYSYHPSLSYCQTVLLVTQRVTSKPNPSYRLGLTGWSGLKRIVIYINVGDS